MFDASKLIFPHSGKKEYVLINDFARYYYNATELIMNSNNVTEHDEQAVVSMFTFNHSLELLFKSIIKMMQESNDFEEIVGAEEAKKLKNCWGHDLKKMHKQIKRFGEKVTRSKVSLKLFEQEGTMAYEWPNKHVEYFEKDNKWLDVMNQKYPVSSNGEFHVALNEQINIADRWLMYKGIWESLTDIYDVLEFYLFNEFITGMKRH